ncbi:MAG: DsrE/DsrF/DrsH-like family protein [Polyangiaceae bacterium]
MEQTSDPMVVDCRGMQCPAPILRLAEAVRRKRPASGKLTVLANDVDFPVDVAAWCRSTKAALLRVERDPQGVFKAEIQLAAPKPAGALDLGDEPTYDALEGLEKTSPSRAAVPVVVLSRAPSEDPPTPRNDVLAPARSVTPRELATAGDRRTRARKTPPPPSARSKPESSRRGLATPSEAAPPEMEAPEPEPASQRRALASAAPRENRAVLLVLRNDLEALLPALMVANACAAQGMEVEMYFAFWGIHLLRGQSSRPVVAPHKPTFLQRILLWLVPQGSRQTLGKMHMGGFGTRLILRLMRRRNILALDGLVASAVSQGVRFRVCSMSMGLMGLRESDILDLPNVDFAGVTSFAEIASRSAMSLVF